MFSRPTKSAVLQVFLLAGVLLSPAISMACEPEDSATEIDTTLHSQPTNRQVRNFLRAAGGTDVQIEETGDAQSLLRANFEQYSVSVVNNHAEGNLQFSVVFNNRSPISLAMLNRANAWNRDQRYTEVYLDESENWVIATFLDCKAGITKANIIAVVEQFMTMTDRFDHFLNEL